MVFVFQERPPFIPEGALLRKKAMEVDAPKRKLVCLVLIWTLAMSYCSRLFEFSLMLKERDLEVELGDDYVLDLQSKCLIGRAHAERWMLMLPPLTSFGLFSEYWDLMNENEKHDKIPEVWEGHNIADYIDPDIMKVRLLFFISYIYPLILMYTEKKINYPAGSFIVKTKSVIFCPESLNAVFCRNWKIWRKRRS